MRKTPFVHLHLHTHYSMLDGICRIPETIAQAVEEEQPAVAITDHGALYGAIEFYQAAEAKGIKPILGCEIGLDGEGTPWARHAGHGEWAGELIVLLAETAAGYHNLLKLVSAAHLDGDSREPRITPDMLAAHHRGLLGLSAGPRGGPGLRLANGDLAGAARAAGELGELLGPGNYYIEVQNHLDAGAAAAGDGALALARRTGLPAVATNNVHYLQREHAAAQDVMYCIHTQQLLRDTRRRRLPTSEYYFKSGAEMAALFPGTPDAVQNTLAVAERCRVALPLGELNFPRFPVPAGEEPRPFLFELCRPGLAQRYGIADAQHPRDDRERAIIQRLHHELETAEKTRFVNYFLVVADFVGYARGQGIPVGPGRGSGAGSLLAYVLGITGIDPLRYGLIFERFLNPERATLPDFDIDFCQERRSEVIAYVRRKYGPDHVAQIITFGTLGAKTVMRDVGRVLEIPPGECERLAGQIAELEAREHVANLRRVLERHPEFRRHFETPGSPCRRILAHALILEGLNRNAGTHAAGVVIGPRPLVEFAPLTRDREGHVITQYGMEALDAVGLLKMDFLGLKTLTVMHQAVERVNAAGGGPLALERIPLDDGPTYALLKRGDTAGLFQVESEGMRDLVRRVGVDSLEDLMALIALYRPGPISMLEDYIRRKTGQAPVTYDHPLLEPIQRETCGVLVYQEQVLRAAHELAGYTLAEADALRRAMAKKDQALMDAQRGRFVAGCERRHRIPADTAERIFESLARFAGYGFSKSHSAPYALLAYQTAYLKAHHPVAFMAALLSGEKGNFERQTVLIAETSAMGLVLRPPDVNRSDAAFLPEEGAIRFGLAGIKHVGESAARQIAEERRRQGPYRNLEDFCRRLDPSGVNRRVIETLIRCGACDSLGGHRAQLWHALEAVMKHAALRARERRAGQRTLFELLPTPAVAAGAGGALPDVPRWSESRLLTDEKERLGMYGRGHPLTAHAWLWEHFTLHTVAQLRGLPDGSPTRIGGMISRAAGACRRPTGEEAFGLEIEDLTGTAEVMLAPETWQRCGALLAAHNAVLLCGRVRQGATPRLELVEAFTPEDAPRRLTERVSLHIESATLNDELLNRIRAILRQHPGPTPARVCLEFPAGEKVFLELGADHQVAAGRELCEQLERLLGEGAVFIEIQGAPARLKP